MKYEVFLKKQYKGTMCKYSTSWIRLAQFKSRKAARSFIKNRIDYGNVEYKVVENGPRKK